MFKMVKFSGIGTVALVLAMISTPTFAAIPCSTAKLIVPWKAGGGTQVLFAIFEKTIAESGVKPKLKLVMIPGQGGNKGPKEAKKQKPMDARSLQFTKAPLQVTLMVELSFIIVHLTRSLC